MHQQAGLNPLAPSALPFLDRIQRLTAADDDHALLYSYGNATGERHDESTDTKGLELLGRSANRKAVAYIL